MLLTKEVEMKWHPSNKKWYENKGYIFTKWRDGFIVSVEDLPNGSHALVDVQCDECGEILCNMSWQEYKKYVKDDGKYYCNKCASKLFGHIKHRETSIKNGKSFYQWCYDNLSEEVANTIILRWNDDLNVDKDGNKLSPKDVSFASAGLNKKGFWFNCLDHPEHKVELKRINSLTSGKQNAINCDQCNKIAVTHPHLIKYFVNKEDAYKYSSGIKKRIPIKCSNCGYEKDISISNYINHGFGCPRCSDGIPYPEKFMLCILEQLLDKDFVVQLSKSTFSWCENYKYDSYINKINCIIETHGLQHYEENKSVYWQSLEETQNNDFDKEWIARKNNIKNYIIIDCRKSELEWIKNSIMSSKLPILLNFKEEDIDWLKAHETGCKSLVKEACELWNSGINSTLEIAEKLKVYRTTISNYLKQGAELEWCDYDAGEEHRKNLSLINAKSCKKVICLTTGEIFNSQTEASNKYKINRVGISSCCVKRIQSSGVHPKTGEKLIWDYYEE